MEPAAVMKCPKCRYGMVYRYNNVLECERCDFTKESAAEIPPRQEDPPQSYASGP